MKTDSDYDHVGMVLRFGKKPEEIYLVEAGEHGCEVRFKRMAHVLAVVGQGERDYFSQVALRKVEFERSDEALKKLS